MPPLRRYSSPCSGVIPPLLYFVNDEIKAPNYILLYKTLTEPLSIALWSTVQATSRAQKELYLDLQVRRPVCVTTIPCEEQQLSIQGYSTFKLANGIPEDLPSKNKKEEDGEFRTILNSTRRLLNNSTFGRCVEAVL
jgi:hypothetical protein